jgi:hypothetical protein
MTDRSSPPPPPPPSLLTDDHPDSSCATGDAAAAGVLSFKCLRCSCVGYLNLSEKIIQSNCVCLCCHLVDSQCVYCGIDQCIECQEKYTLHVENQNAGKGDNGHLQSSSCYFSCSKHCHHQKSDFSDNFNSLSRYRINRRIPPSYKTLLHSSILAGDPDLTWDLLLKGANPFICDASGVTPIDLAKLLISVKIQPTSNERKIFDILPKISYPDSTIEPPTDTRLRTQSDCGPEIPNTFCLSPKKPKMKKQTFRTEKSIIHPTGTGVEKKPKSPRRKSKPGLLSVTTEFSYRPRFEESMLECSTSPPHPPPPFISPKPIKKKQRSMTLTSSQQFPPETPRVHIHNNTFSKSTSHMLSKKERAMTLSDHTSAAGTGPVTAPSSLAPLSYGRARRERAQTITDTSPKKNKIIKNGKIVSTSWDTNDDFVSKRPLLRGLVQSGYRLAKSNAPDLLKGKQVFTPMTLLKLSSDNNDLSAEDFSAPLISPLQNLRHFQPSMSRVVEADVESENLLESKKINPIDQNQTKASEEWVQWEIAQFREIIINEIEIEIPYSQKKISSRTPSALTSRTGSYADMSTLDKDTSSSSLSLSRNPSQGQLSSLTKSSKGSVSNKDLSTSTMVGNESPNPAALPVTSLQAPTPVRSHVQGVASRPNASSPSITKSRINLSHLGNTTSATPPQLAPDASGDDVANAFAVFAQSMNSSTATPPPMLPRHMKGLKSGHLGTPPKSPAVISDYDEKMKSRSPAVISELDDRSNFDLNSDSVDISSLDPPSSVQHPLTPMEEMILTCTGCYDELPSSQMAYSCSRLGCMSHLCQECIFRSVFVTITSALYAVPRIKCPGRCMHAIPTRIWRGILRGMKMSDEDKLTVKVEDQYPILRLLDLLYESFEVFCSDYENADSHPAPSHVLMMTTGAAVTVTDQELKAIHLSDLLKKIETILLQDGYSLLELYNTVYELHDQEQRGEKGDDGSSSSDSDSDESDDDNDHDKILSPSSSSSRTEITSFEEFALLVYPQKIISDEELEKSFLLMEDILNDSEIESNRFGVKKIRKLRLCIFLSHASVIIRSRLMVENLSLISPDYVGGRGGDGEGGMYVMNIYHNDAESLLIKKYVHNANALLTIRCGGCDDTVSLYHIVENGKLVVTEKSEREKVLNKILGQIQPSSPSLTSPANPNLVLLFLRNWIHFLTNRIPAVTFIANTISAYLNSLATVSSTSAAGATGGEGGGGVTNNSKLEAMESQLQLGIIPTDLMKFLDSMMSLVLDVERRFAAQLEIYRKYPKIRVSCCNTKHCFLCKIQGHHKTKTCSEVQNSERGLNCQYCPGCGVATLRTEGCTEILCVCGAVWKWKSDEKKSGKTAGGEDGDGEEKQNGDDGDEEENSRSDSDSSDSESDDDDSSSDSWDDDSDDSDDF